MTDDHDWKRQLILGLSMLVVTGLLVGGIIALVSLKAADVAGLTDEAGGSRPPAPSRPSSAPTTSRTPTSSSPTQPTSTTAPTTTSTTRTTRTTTTTTRTTTRSHTSGHSPTTSGPTHTRPRGGSTNSGFTLTASTRSAGTYDRVRLRGRFTGTGSLRLQRRVAGGRWEAFPAEVARSGSQFTTYVESGRPGLNEFRVVARAGVASSIVEVRIR